MHPAITELIIISLWKQYIKHTKLLQHTGGGIGHDSDDDASDADEGAKVFMDFYIPPDGPDALMVPEAKNLCGKSSCFGFPIDSLNLTFRWNWGQVSVLSKSSQDLCNKAECHPSGGNKWCWSPGAQDYLFSASRQCHWSCSMWSWATVQHCSHLCW